VVGRVLVDVDSVTRTTHLVAISTAWHGAVCRVCLDAVGVDTVVAVTLAAILDTKVLIPSTAIRRAFLNGHGVVGRVSAAEGPRPVGQICVASLGDVSRAGAAGAGAAGAGAAGAGAAGAGAAGAGAAVAGAAGAGASAGAAGRIRVLSLVIRQIQ
jgi:hypothetical protein